MLGDSRDALFVYCSTVEGVSDQFLPPFIIGDAKSPAKEERHVSGNASVIMGWESVLKLLGPFAEMYRVSRSSIGLQFFNDGRTQKRMTDAVEGKRKRKRSTKGGKTESGNVEEEGTGRSDKEAK